MPDRTDHPDRTRSLPRSLGMFFGHIIAGFKADTSKPDPTTVDRRSTTQEESGHAPSGERVTLRRTVIEEIEVTPEDDGRDTDASKEQDR